MKKLSPYLFALILIFMIPGTSLGSSEAPSSVSTLGSTGTNEADLLLLRLDEIKAMDMSKLNSIERKALREEVKSIRARLTNAGGIYISVGGLIIIILLLILIF